MTLVRLAALALCGLVGSAPAFGGDAAAYLEIRRQLGASQFERAAAAAQAEIERDPRAYRMLEAFVEACAAQGTPRTAEGPLEALSAADPENGYVHYALGLVFQSANDVPAALEAFRRAVALAPAFAPAYRELAYTHRLQKTPEEARREIEAALP